MGEWGEMMKMMSRGVVGQRLPERNFHALPYMETIPTTWGNVLKCTALIMVFNSGNK